MARILHKRSRKNNLRRKTHKQSKLFKNNRSLFFLIIGLVALLFIAGFVLRSRQQQSQKVASEDVSCAQFTNNESACTAPGSGCVWRPDWWVKGDGGCVPAEQPIPTLTPTPIPTAAPVDCSQFTNNESACTAPGSGCVWRPDWWVKGDGGCVPAEQPTPIPTAAPVDCSPFTNNQQACTAPGSGCAWRPDWWLGWMGYGGCVPADSPGLLDPTPTQEPIKPHTALTVVCSAHGGLATDYYVGPRCGGYDYGTDGQKNGLGCGLRYEDVYRCADPDTFDFVSCSTPDCVTNDVAPCKTPTWCTFPTK